MEKKSLNKKFPHLLNYFGLDLPYFLAGGFWLMLSTVILAVSGIFLSAMFVRVLTKDVFGQYSFLVSIIGFISVTALPGMGQAVRQAVAENKDGFFIKAILTTFKWSFLGTLVLIFISTYYYIIGNISLAVASLVFAFAFPITSAGSLYAAFLTGKKNFRLASIYTTTAQLVSIGATAFALLVFPNLVAIAFFAAWSTAVISVVLTIFALRYKTNNKDDRKLLGLGFHLSFSQIFTIGADYLDRFLIPIILGFTNNAIYAIAIIIPMQMHSFLKSFTVLGQPKVAQIDSNKVKKSLAVKSIQFEIIVAFVVFIYVVAAPTIFRILYPEYVEEAVFFSQLFSLSLLYYPGNILALLFVRERKAQALYKVNMTYALTTVVLLVLLVPSLGIMGAIVAKLASRAFQLATQVAIFTRLEVKNR